mgnify:CR=1 FL=1
MAVSMAIISYKPSPGGPDDVLPPRWEVVNLKVYGAIVQCH